MRRLIAAIGLAGLLLLGGAPLHAAAIASAPPAVSVPLTLAGHLTIPVTLDGQPVAAILDTGATGALIDSDYAAAHGYKIGRRKLVNGKLTRTTKISYTVGQLKFSTTAVVYPLNQMSRGQAPQPLLIGDDLIYGKYVVELDFDAGQVRLYDRKTFTPPPGVPELKLKAFHLNPFTQASVEGRSPELAVLDTGNQGGVLLSNDYAAQAGIDESYGGRTAAYGGVNSSGVGRMVALKRLEIGGFELTQVPAQVMPEGEKVFSAPINIGLPVLQRFHVWLDRFHQKVWLTPGDHFKDPFPRKVGLEFAKVPGGLKVMGVGGGSAAERAGLKTGDLIVGLDAAVDPDAMAAALEAGKAAGRDMIFKLEDGRALTVGPGEV